MKISLPNGNETSYFVNPGELGVKRVLKVIVGELAEGGGKYLIQANTSSGRLESVSFVHGKCIEELLRHHKLYYSL